MLVPFLGFMKNSADAIAPVFVSASYDNATDTITTEISEENEPVTVYVAGTATGATPTKADIIAGSGTGIIEAGSYSAASGTTSNVLTFNDTNITEFHMVAADPTGNESAIEVITGITISGAFDATSFFAAGELGFIYDPSDLSSLGLNSDGTGAVTTDGDVVRYMADLSGNGEHQSQATTGFSAAYHTDGTYHWLTFDGAEDVMTTAPTPSIVSNTDGFLLGMAVKTPTTDAFEMSQYNINDLRVWFVYQDFDGSYAFSVQEHTNFNIDRRAILGALNTKEVLTFWWPGAGGLSNAKRSDGTTAVGTVTTPSVTSVNEEIKLGGYRANRSAGDFYGAIACSKYTVQREADMRGWLNDRIGI